MCTYCWELKIVIVIDYTVARVNGVLWQLLRFKNLGAPTEKLILFYILKIRSILMFGSVCFHSSLSQELSHRLELQQKRSLAVILGSQYKSYRNALSLTSLPRLDFLREKATLNWAIKAQSNPLHSDMFPLNQSTVETRGRNMYQEYICFTTRYYNSTVPYMTRLLNIHEETTKTAVITTKSGMTTPL